MSPSISPHNLSKFNMDWFTVNGSYATLKKGCVNTFFNTLDEMHKAQESVCAQARECLVDDVTQEQIDYLSSAYDPESMSYSEYRSFLDDLCSFGYFAEEDKPYVSCGVDSGNLTLHSQPHLSRRGASTRSLLIMGMCWLGQSPCLPLGLIIPYPKPLKKRIKLFCLRDFKTFFLK